MMTLCDKELLELAAEAAAINGWFVEDDEWYGTGIVFTDEDDCNRVWNPLTDDGDALRLAVSLELQVIVDGYMAIARTNNPHKFGAQESLSTDSYSATRRAIVRAAAEIGKAMK